MLSLDCPLWNVGHDGQSYYDSRSWRRGRFSDESLWNDVRGDDCLLLSEDLLAKNQATLDDFKTSSPEQRYLNLLRARPDLAQRVPQHQLASYLGITPQSLSRIRKRIAEEVKA
jgi:CRP-like cAMP-binding protein